jgi:hypothetical protein
MYEGCALALSGEAAKALSSISSAIPAFRSTGATVLIPFVLSYLASANAALGQFDDARGSIGEAMNAVKTSGERWCEADIHCAAGKIELMSPERDAAEAQIHFWHALEIARAQQARSWARSDQPRAALARPRQASGGP